MYPGVWLVHHLDTSGCLAQLTTLWLFSNQLGDRTCRALARACRRRTAPPCLRSLWLSNNRIGASGMRALVDVLAAPACGGALVELCVGEVRPRLAARTDPRPTDHRPPPRLTRVHDPASASRVRA